MSPYKLIPGSGTPAGQAADMARPRSLDVSRNKLSEDSHTLAQTPWGADRARLGWSLLSSDPRPPRTAGESQMGLSGEGSAGGRLTVGGDTGVFPH